MTNAEFCCVILGGGGHARVVTEILLATGIARIHGILDADPRRWHTELSGIPILGGDNLLPEVIRDGVNCFALGLGSVGSNQQRRMLYEFAARTGLNALTVAHPSAVCSRSARFGPGSVVFPNATVNAGVVIGVNVIINTAAVVEHDCQIGDHVHIATGAVLTGMVKVNDGAFVGAGAAVRQGVTIGEGAIVGAGAVVVRDAPPYSTVVGVPARPMKKSI
jgi:sugar O-acyltransferase (sialic acid O-acetyltransferase NeuD family)